MAIILPPQSWTRQPQYPVAPNRSGIQPPVLLWTSFANNTAGPYVSPSSIVLGSQSAVGGSVSRVFDGSTNKVQWSGAPNATQASNYRCSFVALAYWSGGSATERTLISLGDSASNNSLFRLAWSSTDAPQFQLRDNLNAETITIISPTPIASGSLVCIVGVGNGPSTTARLYVNGQSVASATSPSNTATFNQTSVGMLWRTTEIQFHNGGIALGAIFDYSLQDSVARSISANPWQLFAPLPRRIFAVEVAAGGSFVPAWAANSSYMTGVCL